MTDERQKEKINEQLTKIVERIKESFGVQVSVFQEVISGLQKELMEKKQELKRKIFQAKEKIK